MKKAVDSSAKIYWLLSLNNVISWLILSSWLLTCHKKKDFDCGMLILTFSSQH